MLATLFFPFFVSCSPHHSKQSQTERVQTRKAQIKMPGGQVFLLQSLQFGHEINL